MPETATLYVAPLPVTTAAAGPAEPLNETSVPVKPATGSLKVTAKLIGDALVGSFWPAAWLIVTDGLLVFHMTVLSIELEAKLPLAAVSLAPFAGIVAVTVPSVVIPETATS